MEKKFIVFPPLISGILLLVAIGGWPYDFYVFVRFVVCGSALYLSYWSIKLKRPVITFLISGVGVLFNPIFSFEFPYETWQIFDAIGAILMFV